MFLAKVTGSLVATQKVDTMVGHKLLVVEPYRIDPQDRSRLAASWWASIRSRAARRSQQPEVHLH